MSSSRRAAVLIVGLATVVGSLLVPRPAPAQIKPQRALVRRPDLVVAQVSFELVRHRRRPDGSLCQEYDVKVNVGNQGNLASGPFTARLERRKGDPFELACPSCEEVLELGAGEYRQLAPRRFNNCSDNWNTYRAFVDYYNKVKEKDEYNNRKLGTFRVPRERVR